jgi:hypothetical protein
MNQWEDFLLWFTKSSSVAPRHDGRSRDAEINEFLGLPTNVLNTNLPQGTNANASCIHVPFLRLFLLKLSVTL